MGENVRVPRNFERRRPYEHFPGGKIVGPGMTVVARVCVENLRADQALELCETIVAALNARAGTA